MQIISSCFIFGEQYLVKSQVSISHIYVVSAVLHKDILKSARDISKSIQRQLKQRTEKSEKYQHDADSTGDGDEDEDEDIDGDVVTGDLQKLQERVDALKTKAKAKSEVARQWQTSEEGKIMGKDGNRKGGNEKEKDEEEEDADVMEEFNKGR